MAAFQIIGRVTSSVISKSDYSKVFLGRYAFKEYVSSRKKHNLVGFVGLGNMGGPMALNLLKKGHQLVVFDVNPESMATLADQGALLAKHPADLASKAETIITMLPSNKHVLTVYTGPEGIFESLRTGTLLIDCSTVAPSVSQEQIAPKAELAGAGHLDAPVSGGVNAAKGGTLTFMVGGPKGEVEAARPLLMDMGSKVVHCGPIGTGQAAKICNNMLLAISMIGTSEAMNLGIKLGLAPKTLMDIMNASSGRCWSSELYNPVPDMLPNVPASNSYKGGFGNRLMSKDLRLSQAAANQVDVVTPLGALANQVYALLASNPEFSDLDFSSVFKFLNLQHEVKPESKAE
ncbi:3-hydroxyisobutyrate dehydrogenase, mitochondrial [Ischnura elegans]|uniref:3-hydroxyisobutyrate dehydrogenase, mitochondrial n=1 Tax=Ischnura elegans TaxID=197161 RepID=UPI001ED8AFD8|nr:3-hydroxyisobutyrate dehydrogenase, mitochondrial [Ischnura elegans]